MNNPHVKIIIVTDYDVIPECWEAVLHQDYDNFSILTSTLAAEQKYEDYSLNRDYNITRHRNHARQMALATEFNHFLLVDSDVTLPLNALSLLMKREKPFVSGWYPARFPKGRKAPQVASVIRDGIMCFFAEPYPDLIEVDSTGLGCTLLHRKILEKVNFRYGNGEMIRTSFGYEAMSDDASRFCFDVKSAGYQVYMDGDVVCKHIFMKEVAA